MQAQSDDACKQRRNINADLHKTIIDQIKLQQQRRSHEQPHEEADRNCEQRGRIKNNQCKQDAKDKTKNTGGDRENQGPAKSGEKDIGIGGDNTKIKCWHEVASQRDAKRLSSRSTIVTTT
ncbi:hypothetical protein D3C80_1676640 [compost metagenome]